MKKKKKQVWRGLDSAQKATLRRWIVIIISSLLFLLLILTIRYIFFKFNFKAQPANSDLINEVRNSVTIVDSLSRTRGGSSYKLHVLVEQDASFIPIGIQLMNVVNTEPVNTLKLSSIPQLNCYGSSSILSSGRPAYETKWTSEPEFFKLAYANKKQVTLLIKLGTDVFFVGGLEIDGNCFWIQE